MTRVQGAASISTGGLIFAPSMPIFIGLFSSWCCSVSVVMPTLQVSGEEEPNQVQLSAIWLLRNFPFEKTDECGEAIFLSSVCWQLRNLCPLLCVSCHRLLPWTLRLRTRSAKRKVCIAKEATLSSSVCRPVWDCSRIYKVDVSSQLRRQLGGWWARSECFGCAQRIRNEEGRKEGRKGGRRALTAAGPLDLSISSCLVVAFYL